MRESECFALYVLSFVRTYLFEKVKQAFTRYFSKIKELCSGAGEARLKSTARKGVGRQKGNGRDLLCTAVRPEHYWLINAGPILSLVSHSTIIVAQKQLHFRQC
jgi:hypothetical protein